MQNSTFKQLFATLNICLIIVKVSPCSGGFFCITAGEEFDSTPPSGHNLRRRQNQINLSGAGIVISDLFPPYCRLSGPPFRALQPSPAILPVTGKKTVLQTPAETNPANAGRQLTESQYTLSAMQIQHFSESGNCTKNRQKPRFCLTADRRT